MKKRNPSIHAQNRQELVLATRKAGRELSVYSTMFNTIIADRMGLAINDLRSWDLLHIHGPMSAGRLARMLGLSGGAVTALIKRLERVGAVTRHIDPTDRRKVIIRVVYPLRDGSQKGAFQALGARIMSVLNQFSDKELEASWRLMHEVGMVMQQETTHLRSMEETEAEDRHAEQPTAGALVDAT
jgi:DNA-binding MarR family transcriptional regulator